MKKNAFGKVMAGSLLLVGSMLAIADELKITVSNTDPNAMLTNGRVYDAETVIFDTPVPVTVSAGNSASSLMRSQTTGEFSFNAAYALVSNGTPVTDKEIDVRMTNTSCELTSETPTEIIHGGYIYKIEKNYSESAKLCQLSVTVSEIGPNTLTITVNDALGKGSKLTEGKVVESSDGIVFNPPDFPSEVQSSTSITVQGPAGDAGNFSFTGLYNLKTSNANVGEVKFKMDGATCSLLSPAQLSIPNEVTYSISTTPASGSCRLDVIAGEFQAPPPVTETIVTIKNQIPAAK